MKIAVTVLTALETIHANLLKIVVLFYPNISYITSFLNEIDVAFSISCSNYWLTSDSVFKNHCMHAPNDSSG